jgi:hypothetical protein
VAVSFMVLCFVYNASYFKNTKPFGIFCILMEL